MNMSISREALCAEIDHRIEKTREEMSKRGYDALIVYGNNKVYGSLRYLTDYFPDRCGWISVTGTETYLFDGAALLLPIHGDPALLLDTGLVLGKEVCTKKIVSGDFGAGKESGLSASKIAKLLAEHGQVRKIGIETWDRFPAPLYLDLQREVPNASFVRSTIVEELRMIKSPLELDIFRKAAIVGDIGHQVFADNLRQNGIGKTELELIRQTEFAMRKYDPIYEDAVENSPSLICSGYAIGGGLLHLPHHSKTIQPGDAVHWDICTRYNGYAIDTSRTKVVGKPTPEQQRAYDTSLSMLEKVLEIAKPDLPAVELVHAAENIAQSAGYQLMDHFLGHGIGIDPHERPDLVREETPLQENMVMAIEPRVSIDNIYVLGIEEMVLITSQGGVSLTQFERTPLGI
jgi:Xaa-Pro aminopeptidase